MLDFGFYNMDCLEGMKEFPDNYFELAIVDPPYGCGFSDNGGGGLVHQIPSNQTGGWNRFGGRFDKYKHSPSESGGWHGKDKYHLGDTINTKIVDSPTGAGAMRSGEEQTRTKKLLRGTLPRNKNILRNCFASHVTRLFGGAITFYFHQRGALLYGKS